MLDLTVKACSYGIGYNYQNMRGLSVITPNYKRVW